jgi:two-component system, NtrC family, nitrogen regulation response regulator GlnG
VRQLVNACRRLTVTAPGREIRTEDIPARSRRRRGRAAAATIGWPSSRTGPSRNSTPGTQRLLDQAVPEVERILIRVALRKAEGLKQEAAKLLGWGRNTLTRKMKELGMEDAVRTRCAEPRFNRARDHG